MKIKEKLAEEYFRKNYEDIVLSTPPELSHISDRFFYLASNSSKLSFKAGFEKAVEIICTELLRTKDIHQIYHDTSVIDALEALRGEIEFVGEEEAKE